MRKTLGIGEDDYRLLISNHHYYVDKTLLIKDFLDDGSKVTLITRPRRFGKTLNMSMMAEFLDITKDSKEIFKNTNIMETDKAEFMNEYPVIFISFKDIKGSNKDDLFKMLFSCLYSTFGKYEYLFDEKKIKKTLARKIIGVYEILGQLGYPSREDVSIINESLALLCQVLYEYFGKPVIMLIDEYDTPFIEAHNYGFYDEVHRPFSTLLSTALKGNSYLNKALLTGIQRIAKENIFSGLNNLSVYGVDKKPYGQYFGLIESEAKDLLAYYDLQLTNEVKEMYDGYRIGEHEIYNPWSISKYANEKELTSYWVNTASNTMIKNLMNHSTKYFKDDYETLIKEGSMNVHTNLETSYFEEASDETLWALLINSGYLTILEKIDMDYYKICIPNDEVKKAFKDLTANFLGINERFLNRIEDSLRNGDILNFIKNYKNILLENISYHDLVNENSYHMLMNGLCAYMYNTHKVVSNLESGKGRCDIILYSLNKEKYPNYILEFKYTKDKEADLQKIANEAIHQIYQNQYDAGMHGETYYLGLAHCGKEVEVLYENKVLE